MRKFKEQGKVANILALLVFGVFALSVAAVLLTGAQVYRNLTLRGGESYDHRTAAGYVTNRFRQADSVEMEDFEDVTALVAREELGGRVYVTRIYCYEGALRELYSTDQAAVSPADGEILLEMESLSVTREDGLLYVTLEHPDGQVQELWLADPMRRAAP